MAYLFDYTAAGLGDNASIMGTDYGATRRAGIKFVVPAGGMLLDYYKVNIKILDAGGNVEGEIRLDNEGAIGDAVSDTMVIVDVQTTGVKTFSVSGSVSLVAGTYWLVFRGNAAPVNMNSGYDHLTGADDIFVTGDYYNTTGWVELALAYTESTPDFTKRTGVRIQF